jgi:hypothetical protein
LLNHVVHVNNPMELVRTLHLDLNLTQVQHAQAE